MHIYIHTYTYLYIHIYTYPLGSFFLENLTDAAAHGKASREECIKEPKKVGWPKCGNCGSKSLGRDWQGRSCKALEALLRTVCFIIGARESHQRVFTVHYITFMTVWLGVKDTWHPLVQTCFLWDSEQCHRFLNWGKYWDLGSTL